MTTSGFILKLLMINKLPYVMLIDEKVQLLINISSADK